MADENEDNEFVELRDKVTDLDEQFRSAQEALRLATIQLGTVERNVDDAKAVAQEALEAAQDAAGSVTGDGDGGGDDDDEPETPPPLDSSVVEPYAYKVIEASGQIFCYVPKKPDQEDGGNSGAKELYGGAYGGPHLGSKESPKADKDSPPYAAAGFSGISGDFSWAHYGWHSVGSVTPESGKAAEKVVVASFKVPLDPPEDQRDSQTEVEGPSLTSIDLCNLSSWKGDCEQSWKQFDPAAGSGTTVTRKIPIALVANGLVTQLCMGVPFVDRGGGDGSGDPTRVDTRELGKSGLESGDPLSGKCQKSVDFYSYPTPAPSGLSGEGQYQKTTKTVDPETGEETTTVTRTDDEDEADKTVTDVLQIYDFTKPEISVTEIPVPTPVDSSGDVSGPVFLIRDPGGTGDTCPTVKYTQLKLIDNRCPPPDVWLESGQGDSVTLKVRSWSKNSSGECESGVTQYTFTPTSIDAPDCSAIKACISGETQTVVTDVFVSGGSLYKRVRTAKALEWGDPSDVMIVSGTTCENGGTG